jgi:hypothetical protein
MTGKRSLRDQAMSVRRKARESLLRFWAVGEPWETLRQRIADDGDLMSVVARTSAENIAQDQTGRMLFAAIAYLGEKYKFEVPSDVAWDSFGRLRESLMQHAEEFAALLQRPAQINDPLRCVALYPGFLYAARRASCPIALVEIGPSFGLNLCMDLYSYEYLGIGRTGRLDSRCHMVAEVDDLASRGRPGIRSSFRLPDQPPIVGARIGLELNPISTDDDSLAWMRAFLFPRSKHLFEEALAIRRRTQLRIVKGNAADTLARGISFVPAGQVPLVFHTSVAYQMSDAARDQLSANLANAALERRVMYMTWNEEPARRGALLQVTDLDLAHDKAPRHLLGFVNRWDPVPKLEWVHSGTDE